ncbi:MAG TPA: glycosyltransferase family 4 protein, partial [Thermoanaerobaculia bacterium]
MSLGLCRHAVARGHSVLLACADDGDMVEAYRAAGAAVRRASIRPLASRRPFALGRSVGSLAALVRRERLDVLFTSQVSYVSLLAAVSLMTGVRSAVHLGVAYEFPSPLFWTAARFVGMGIAPSEHTAEAWRRRGWRSGALQVVPNGVDTSVFCPGPRPAARARLRLSEDVPTVAYVGRLVREKGILTLLRAFARYRQKAQTGRLLLVGEAPGDQIAELHRVADEQGLKKDAWQVREPTSAPEDVYRAADLVVVPSEWDEPFGLVALEAGACGVVTVVSDRGVLPSLV